MNYPPKECPRYEKCSVNHCPLDPDQDRRLPHPGDSVAKCTMEKGVRSRVGEKYPDLLPLKGLTPREAAGARTWSNCPPSEREARLERAKQALGKARGKNAHS